MRKSKKLQLLQWLKTKDEVSSLQIEQWAYNNHNIMPTTARRRARELVEARELERFSKPGKALVYYKYIPKEKVLVEMASPLKQINLGI